MPAFPDRGKPSDFDSLVLEPGNRWLAKPKRGKRPPPHWTKDPIMTKLRQNFRSLCGYTLMHEMKGTVDHFISCKNDLAKAYEWENYRYCTGSVNSSKKNDDDTVFDPWEIEFEWFEIHMPSMIMIVSPSAPVSIRAKLELSLKRLPIGDTDEVIDCRGAYYKGYKAGEMKIEWMEAMVPVLAASIRKWEAANPGQPLP